MRNVTIPLLVYVLFVIYVPTPALSDGQEWKNNDDYMYQLTSPASDGLEAVNATVDEILIYKRPMRDRRWFAVADLLAMEADFQTVSRQEIAVLLGGVQDYDFLESTDYCYRNNGVWTFHTLVFDYDLKRVAYIQVRECAPKPGMPRSRDAGSIFHRSTENTTASSSRSIIQILRELGVPGA